MFKKNNILDLVVGILITLIGIYIWFHPLDTLIMFAIYIGIMFIFVGAAYLLEFFKSKDIKYVTYGLTNVVIGTIFTSHGSMVATTLAIIFAIWILFSSILQFTTAMRLKQEKTFFWIYPLLLSIIGLIFSLIILHKPSTGVLTVALIIGTYMVTYGLIEIFEFFLIEDLEKK